MKTANYSQRQAHSQQAAAACSVDMSTITKLAASTQLANYPAVIALGVATHCSQLKARPPLDHNTAHSTAHSMAKAYSRKIPAPSEARTRTTALVAGKESRHANRYTTRRPSIIWRRKGGNQSTHRKPLMMSPRKGPADLWLQTADVLVGGVCDSAASVGLCQVGGEDHIVCTENTKHVNMRLVGPVH